MEAEEFWSLAFSIHELDFFVFFFFFHNKHEWPPQQKEWPFTILRAQFCMQKSRTICRSPKYVILHMLWLWRTSWVCIPAFMLSVDGHWRLFFSVFHFRMCCYVLSCFLGFNLPMGWYFPSPRSFLLLLAAVFQLRRALFTLGLSEVKKITTTHTR